jgi:carotenoid cleavage dioxygenase
VEFPTVNDDKVGHPSRYIYTVARMNGSRYSNSIVKYDTVSGTRIGHEIGPDIATGEAVFVPADETGGTEDDGWLICIATKGDGTASRLVILDASDPFVEPVATVELPRGVPAGFHGSWIPDLSE